MLLDYNTNIGVVGVSSWAHEVLGFETCTLIEFFGTHDMPKMKQALLVPGMAEVPLNLRNENVVDYEVPDDYIFTRLHVNEGMVNGQRLVLAQIYYKSGDEGEERCHNHVLFVQSQPN